MNELRAAAAESYLPLRGDGAVIVGFSGRDELSMDAYGLFYRGADVEYGNASDLAHMQAWVERAWKTPHFSAESAVRLGVKLQKKR